MPAPSAFPANAVSWLAPPGRLLLLGRSAATLAAALASTDHRLVACADTRDGVRALTRRAPRAVPTVAPADRLPFAPLSFDGVMVHQALHALPDAALAEVARVLAPGGTLAASYVVRDDSVPWVRRLVALLRAVDPQAMAGDYGTDSFTRLEASPHFAAIEERRHRLWVPISRVDLLDMVARRFPDLPDADLRPLLGSVGDLYESSARAPEPLLLPYQVVCRRARVDHAHLDADLSRPDDALSIRLWGAETPRAPRGPSR